MCGFAAGGTGKTLVNKSSQTIRVFVKKIPESGNPTVKEYTLLPGEEKSLGCSRDWFIAGTHYIFEIAGAKYID